jgi:ZIP family zinc transporter
VRWINISGENFHTMHTHGHYQRVIERDAQPVPSGDVEDTVNLGPGQRADVIIDANQQPGSWLVHCHVMDHTEDAQGYPDGLVTTIHYAGTPENAAAMNTSMRGMLPNFGTTAKALPFGWTILLGAIAGFTIFLGLPIARMRNISPQTVGALNAIAIGILVFLVVEIAGNATRPLTQALERWHTGAPAHQAILLALAYAGGLLIGLVGLGTLASRVARRAAAEVHDPFLLASIIAIGIGAHNFAEGLAIGASAAAGATAIAVGLIVGFALHNATEGFGIAAPLAGRDIRPRRRQLFLAGIVAGGPTFIGTIVGYAFSSPVVSVLFLATAIGALVYVIGELWSVLRRSPGMNALMTSMLACGFFIALATEIVVDLNGG